MSRKHNHRISTLGSRITATVSVTLVLLLLGCVAITALVSRTLSADIRSNAGFVVRMEPGVTEARCSEVYARLTAADFAQSAVFNSASEILARESEALGEDISQVLEENPYSAEFEVMLLPGYAVTDSLEVLVPQVRAWDGVAEVLTDTSLLEGINRTLDRVMWILLVSAAALLLISCVLISNTVSLSVYSRRFVIHTMRLVGATAGFIRRPFVLSGVLSGVVSGLLASVLICLGRLYLGGVDEVFVRALPWTDMAWVCVAVTVAGTLICACAAWVSTARYLRSTYDDLFLK